MESVILARGDKARKIIYEYSRQAAEERLHDHGYSDRQIRYIFYIEKLWNKYRKKYETSNHDQEIINDFLVEIEGTLEGLSYEYRRKYHKRNIKPSDFVQEFRIATWKLFTGEYSEKRSKWTFYERMMMMFHRRAIDLVRQENGTRSKQRKRERHAVDLSEIEEETSDNAISTERQATAKAMVSDILNSNKLSDEDKNVLEFMLQNPNATHQEIADNTGLSNKMAVCRILRKIRSKLQQS